MEWARVVIHSVVSRQPGNQSSKSKRTSHRANIVYVAAGLGRGTEQELIGHRKRIEIDRLLIIGVVTLPFAVETVPVTTAQGRYVTFSKSMRHRRRD